MPRIPASRIFGAAARAIVESQQSLDDRGRDSIIRWQHDGIPPTVFTWTRCRLTLTVALDWQPRQSAVGHTQLLVAAQHQSTASVSIGFRFLLRPQDRDPEE
jgi:hypothetical protein